MNPLTTTYSFELYTITPLTLNNMKKGRTIMNTSPEKPQYRKSWEPIDEIVIPDETNALAFRNPCVIICITTSPGILIDAPINITQRCTAVLNAIIFLASNQEGKNKDIMIMPTTDNTILLKPNNMDNITPATTIVDECNRDDTGVGPSMAIGSQYEKIQMADLPKIANMIITQLPEQPMKIIRTAKSPKRL
jgi:hypothetical protein